MRRHRALLSTILLTWLACAVPAVAQLKVGTVDVNRAIKEHPRTKDAEAKINEARTAAKKEFDERAESYKRTLEEVDKLSSQLEAPALGAEGKAAKAKERDAKIAALRTMEREINEFRATREQQLQQQVLRMRESIVQEITDAVMERVKANNMDLVLDKSGATANGLSAILFSRDSADFTAEVIASLHRSQPKATATPAKP